MFTIMVIYFAKYYPRKVCMHIIEVIFDKMFGLKMNQLRGTIGISFAHIAQSEVHM